MDSSEAAKLVIPGVDIAEDSETTVEIKIKTLDSQTYSLRVNKRVPVPALKEQIATVTGVLSEQQRLICRGKVMKDDQLLSAYHVEDGHTLHLVVRQPHQSVPPSTGSEGASHPGTSSAQGGANQGNPVTHSFVFESVNVGHGDMDNSIISRIISSILDSVGAASTGSGNSANDIREMISERLARTSNDGSGLPTSAQQNPANPQRERRQSNIQFSSSIPSGSQNSTVIPDSLATLSLYIGLMRDEFSGEGFGAEVGQQINIAEATGLHINEGHNHDSHSPAAQVGLPTPASLAEILLSSRQLLIEQTGECLSQLARQLAQHSSITDPTARMNMQTSAMRYGVLIRNLGSMLLELGRTIMTLRMGQSPAEAVVNAGPANFISATGPNPLMVQAVPFSPGPNAGGSTGTQNSGETPEATFAPRNVEIRIRTAVGRAVPVATTNTNEPQQQQEDQTTNPSGVDSGVRVVPLRSAVVGVSPLTSDAAASSVRLFYPLLARVRQATAANASSARGAQAPTQPHQSPSAVDQFHAQGVNFDSNRSDANTAPAVSGPSPPANGSAAHQGLSSVFVSSQPHQNSNSGSGENRANGDRAGYSESNNTASAVSEQGVFLSNVLQQLMPLINPSSEVGASSTNASSTAGASSTNARIESEHLSSSSSSRHQRDPPEPPSPKRTKRESE